MTETIMSSIEWIFFDVGNVLFNDERQNFYAYLRLRDALKEAGYSFSFSELMKLREELVLEGTQWINQKIARRFLSEAEFKSYRERLFAELHDAFDENHLFDVSTKAMLERLSMRYRLGIIANQPAEARESLRRRGILQLFDVVAISDELGMSKPEVDIYLWALRQIPSEPGVCLMVGDRLDNDVAPAKAVGMKAAHLDWRVHLRPRWDVVTEEEQLYRASTTRLPLFMNGTVNLREAVTPDVTISDLTELERVLA